MMKKKYLLCGMLSASLLLAACGGNDEEAATDTTDQTEDVETGDTGSEESVKDLSIKALYTAPHGTKSFATTFVVMDGDVVHDVIIDEFQFMEGDDWTGVPNADATFGGKYAEGFTLVSKRENSDGYSAMMTDIAGSTTSYNDNMDAIQDFAKGKTVAELEEAIAALEALGEDEEIADVVSGATFVDTNGYLQSVVDTINDGIEFAGAEGSLANAELAYSLQAPHGDQAFALVAVLHDGDTVLAAAVDELQFVDPADFEGVPNSDDGFGETYGEGVVLASKMFNDEAYSAMMTNFAQATETYGGNMSAIVEFAAGQTVDDIQATIDELNDLGEEDSVSDVVSGATFVDTAGYLQAVVDTLK